MSLNKDAFDPCVNQCSLQWHSTCRGCGRTQEEKDSWPTLCSTGKFKIILRLPNALDKQKKIPLLNQV